MKYQAGRNSSVGVEIRYEQDRLRIESQWR